MEQYAESTKVRSVVRGIAPIIPGVGSAIGELDDALLRHLERTSAERLNTLIEELETGIEDFSGPIQVHRADVVLHAAYVTIEATLRTNRREKIRAFARLLIAGLEIEPKMSLEYEFEDYLKILDELSSRELAILAILAEHEEAATQENENELQRSSISWEDFETEACERLGVPHAEFSGLLARLARTGMYEPITGTIWGYSGGQGKLTGTYYRLANLVQATPSMFDTGRSV